jgi:hypothetical protein
MTIQTKIVMLESGRGLYREERRSTRILGNDNSSFIDDKNMNDLVTRRGVGDGYWRAGLTIRSIHWSGDRWLAGGMRPVIPC